MRWHSLVSSLRQRLEKFSVPFIRDNAKVIGQFILTLFFILIAAWFIRHERAELNQVGHILSTAQLPWLVAGIVVMVLYIILQALMYVFSFSSVRSEISLWDATILFLKRNFISVFLPAGGVSSLAFFSGALEKKGVTKSQIYFASSVYGFIGILSVILVAIPAFLYAFLHGSVGNSDWYGLMAVTLLITILYVAYRAVFSNGPVSRLIIRLIPASEVFIEDLRSQKISSSGFLWTTLISVLIDLTGIFHVFIAMKALGMEPSLLAALMGYLVAVIFLVVSPFLRGLGAIEVSMVYVLSRFGYSAAESMAITLLYRFFEFWLPLLAGMGSFLLRINKLLMRVLPAILLFTLGVINIISILTPAIPERLAFMKDILFIEIINGSNLFVFISGLFLLVTSAFMLKGLRSAWWLAVILTGISVIGNLAKAFDYEESIAALLVLIILIASRKEYYIRSNPKLKNIGIQSSLLSVAAVMIYGIIGFYFLDKIHFNIDFSWKQSIRYTFLNYFLIGSSDLIPADHFARIFLYSINISGFLSITFFIYTIILPYFRKNAASEEELSVAKDLVKQFGNSSLDYFKTYTDKSVFFNAEKNAFLAYRIAGNFAVVLEDPVAGDIQKMKECIGAFDRYCYESGVKSIYYRVPEEHLSIYKGIGKKSLFMGQEGVVDLSVFSLEGGSRKPIRNAINKIRDKGYKAQVHVPPVKDGILQKIKSVSDEWLEDTERDEIIFSQGMFVWEELKQQVIITVENPEEKIIAFINIIPDFAVGEGTYDLIRKTKDAPNGIMDFILIEMFNYFKAQGIMKVNLGFAPMSGNDDPHNFPERSMKFAYERIRSFSHYKGLRDYKEKFEPLWTNKYLVYDHDYDLLQIPSALTKVIKP